MFPKRCARRKKAALWQHVAGDADVLLAFFRMRAQVVSVAVVLISCSGHEPHAPIATSTPTTGWHGSDTSSTSASSGTDDGSMTAADETGDTGACPNGTEGCPCAASQACDPNLVCLSNFCVDAGGNCPIGTVGCPCTQGGTCDPGLQCVSMKCTDPT
jgi:hypothetical protein